MKILAIESSCDETAAAVVENGSKVLTNVIASQIAIHKETGGVMPEVAAREHIKAIIPTVEKAMEDHTWDEIDAVAVTKEPGLIGSLVIGRISAAVLAFAKGKPLIEVNHIHGHMYANWLDTETEPQFPIVILTVSGGHNELVLMRSHGDFEKLGETLDDAAGEAFDKVARLLKLGYPGGPAIEKAAINGNPRAVEFPRGMKNSWDFSFSGLKTSVLYFLQKDNRLDEPQFVADVAASFQEAVADALVEKLMMAVKKYKPKEVHLSGGVSANKYLRARIERELDGQAVFRHPKKMSYCTDNAAMIGGAAYFMN